jgi:ABC-type transporter Mla subunit MlaD
MKIDTPYELKIPRDSVVFTETAGVLGETYFEIDSSQASGTPIESGGTLQTKATNSPSTVDWLETFDGALERLDAEVRERGSDAASAGKPCPQKTSKDPKTNVPK